jgi:hypothetical protein
MNNFHLWWHVPYFPVGNRRAYNLQLFCSSIRVESGCFKFSCMNERYIFTIELFKRTKDIHDVKSNPFQANNHISQRSFKFNTFLKEVNLRRCSIHNFTQLKTYHQPSKDRHHSTPKQCSIMQLLDLVATIICRRLRISSPSSTNSHHRKEKRYICKLYIGFEIPSHDWIMGYQFPHQHGPRSLSHASKKLAEFSSSSVRSTHAYVMRQQGGMF